MKRNILAMLLALAMLLSLMAGCGSTSASAPASEDQTEAAASDAQTAAEADGEAAAPADESAEQAELADETAEEAAAEDYGAPVVIDGWTPRANAHYSEGEDVSPRVIDYDYQQDYNYDDYRIADPGETIDLTMFFTLQNQYAGLLDDYNDNPSLQTAEEITGVHMDFVYGTGQEANTQMNLMIASGDYTNIIDKFLSNYTAGGDHAIEEEIIYDLTDLLPEYAPDYYEIINTTEEVRRSTASDTGKNAAFFTFAELQPGPRMGLFIRQDWLDELELDVPETYDEFHDVLLAFKDAYNPAMPLLMTETGIMGFDTLAAGYNVAYAETSGFYQIDGEVHYSMVEEGFREYLTMMHQWYEEGLLNNDFTSVNMMTQDSYIVNSQSGLWTSMSRMTQAWQDSLRETDDNAEISPVPNAVKNKGDVLHINNTKSYVDKYGSSITTACDEELLIAALKWNNFWYTDLGSLLCNYGIEGVSFEFDDAGVPHYTSLITEDPDYSMLQMIFQYLSASFNSVYQSRSGDLELSDKAAWNVNNDGAYDLPGYLTMTAEESEEYTSTFNSVDTYVSECMAKFIIGDMDLSEFDAFVDSIYSMGIEDCIAIKQAAYDRYLAR